MVALKHKAERLAAQPGEFIAGEVGNVFAGKQVAPRGGAVEAAKDVHQGGFARARRADNGDEFTGVDRQADAFEHVNFRCVDTAVDLADVLQLDQGSTHLASVAGGRADQQMITLV